MTEFTLPVSTAFEFYAELPAYLILGLVCGLVAAALMRGIFLAEDFASEVQAWVRLRDGFVRP